MVNANLRNKGEGEDASPLTLVSVFMSYLIMLAFAYIEEAVSFVTGKDEAAPPAGYGPLYDSWDSFFVRHFFRGCRDLWGRPICSAPGTWLTLMDRTTHDMWRHFVPLETRTRALNLGSYNYLGFAGPDSPCTADVLDALDEYGLSAMSPLNEAGCLPMHRELEEEVAEFLGTEDAMIYGMGFATNSSVIPSVVGKGGLIVSDTFNHKSIIVGAKASGAKVKPFLHNDMEDLERVLRKAIVEGQPRTHRPWTKIVIIVEGLYSMEGHATKLREVIALKKKYGCYVYLDEAHSIGAMGPHGKGICDHLGIAHRDVDILMGTFTKSFGGAGGYIAGSKELCAFVRRTAGANNYATSMSPGVCAQVLSALRIIRGKDGSDLGKRKIEQLKENSNFFRRGLLDIGAECIASEDSPVLPIMMYSPSKVVRCSREMLKRSCAVVAVGWPATSLLASRIRFCISAAHTKEDMTYALQMLEEVMIQGEMQFGKEYVPPAERAWGHEVADPPAVSAEARRKQRERKDIEWYP